MADLSDVETALAESVVAALYPGGIAAASVTGEPVRVYRGWPLTGPLDLDLAAGICNVSVFAVPGDTRNTTRWAAVTQTTQAAARLSVTVSGTAATFGGAGGVGQVAGLLADGQPFVYRGQAGDTPALVAAVLAQDVRATRACWLSGATVSVPGAARLLARVVADGSALTEWGRQEQGFRISAWCPNPAARDLVCSTIGSAFSAVSFLALADGTSGRLRYRSTTSIDDAQNAQLYRRDLVFGVEYATSFKASAPSLLFGDVRLAGSDFYG